MQFSESCVRNLSARKEKNGEIMSTKTKITKTEYWKELDRLNGGIKIIDQGAATSAELAKRYTTSESHCRKRVSDLVKLGKIEQVWKYGECGRLVHAYRPKIR